jgi:hypothetical protein
MNLTDTRTDSPILGRHLSGSILVSEIYERRKKMFHLIKFNIKQRNKSSSEKTAPHKAI